MELRNKSKLDTCKGGIRGAFFSLGWNISGRGRRVLLLPVFGEIFCRGFVG